MHGNARGPAEKRTPCGSFSAVLVVSGFFIALAGCATTPSFRPIPIVGEQFRIPPDFRIVGYFPSWSGEPADVQYQALTHINYAFLEPTSAGGYEPVARPEKLREVVALAHAYGVKVLASLGGSSDGTTDAFRTISEDTGIASVFIDCDPFPRG